MPTTPITDWGAAVVTSFAAALALFLSGVPKIIGFLVVLAIGWFVAGAIGRLVTGLLERVRFSELSDRVGLTTLVRQMGLTLSPPRFIGEIAKWFIRVVVLIAAFDVLGLPAVSRVLEATLLWLPNLVVAIAALIIGGLVANALARIVRGASATAQLGDPDLLANVARFGVLAFAIVVAVNQVGIAADLVNMLFAGVVGALALALGLAFGLGGRETAARVLTNWYQRGRTVAPRVQTQAREEPEEMPMSREEVRAGDGRGRR
jgi:hypothetical protein